MKPVLKRVTALAIAGAAIAVLAGCSPAAQATAPPARPVAASTDSAGKVAFTCTLADLFFSKLKNATFVQGTPGSGNALYAQNVSWALIDDNQLEAAKEDGLTAFDSDLGTLRSAVLNATPPAMSLPSTVSAPPFDAQDPKISQAITKVGADCQAAGFAWGIDATGG